MPCAGMRGQSSQGQKFTDGSATQPHTEGGGGKRVGGAGLGGSDLSLLEERVKGATAADNLNKKLTQQLVDERGKAEEATGKVRRTLPQ